jgi:hypothetical protein
MISVPGDTPPGSGFDINAFIGGNNETSSRFSNIGDDASYDGIDDISRESMAGLSPETRAIINDIRAKAFDDAGVHAGPFD